MLAYPATLHYRTGGIIRASYLVWRLPLPRDGYYTYQDIYVYHSYIH